MMRGFPKVKKCKNCGTTFEATSAGHLYCGDRKKKTGCAHLREVEYSHSKKRHDYVKSRRLKNLAKARKYEAEFKRKKRANDPKYVAKQKACTKRWADSNRELLRQKNKEWRRKNIKKILHKNRERKLMLSGVVGTHTAQEWEELKKRHGYKCVTCGISEEELNKKWRNVHPGFCRLTKDHKKPLSVGGSNYIDNIQPLCVSCNSRKRDKSFKLVFTCGVCDMFHKGHINLLKKMGERGDLVMVILHDGFTTFKNKQKLPIENLEKRTRNLIDSGLVDIVKFTFEEEPHQTFERLIGRYKEFQLLFMRGDDWQDFPGKATLEKHGIPIEYVPYTEGVSSTMLRNYL
jgi:cytidyltransferase-like protein